MTRAALVLNDGNVRSALAFTAVMAAGMAVWCGWLLMAPAFLPASKASWLTVALMGGSSLGFFLMPAAVLAGVCWSLRRRPVSSLWRPALLIALSGAAGLALVSAREVLAFGGRAAPGICRR